MNKLPRKLDGTQKMVKVTEKTQFLDLLAFVELQARIVRESYVPQQGIISSNFIHTLHAFNFDDSLAKIDMLSSLFNPLTG